MSHDKWERAWQEVVASIWIGVKFGALCVATRAQNLGYSIL